jgi:epoxide hydrolase
MNTDSTIRPFTIDVSQAALNDLYERDHNVVRWTESERGGHFMALEAPDFLINDIRRFFHDLR